MAPDAIFVPHNLFAYGKKERSIWKDSYLRFDPKKYPVVPGGWKKNEDVWKKLAKDICLQANKTAHSELVLSGMQSNGQTKLLKCRHYRTYASSKDPSQAQGERRQYSFTCDRAKNSRGQSGQSMPKNTSTSLPIGGECRCKVTLGFRIDQSSIYLTLGIFEETHQGHPPIVPADRLTRKGIAPKVAMDDMKQAAVSNIGPGQSGTFLKNKHGCKFSRRQVAYHQKFAKLAESLVDAKDLEAMGDKASSTDVLLDYLDRQGATYFALYHSAESIETCPAKERPTKTKLTPPDIPAIEKTGVSSSGSVWIETNNGKAENANADPLISRFAVDTKEESDLMKYAKQSREDANANDQQDVLIALVWITPDNLEILRAYPEVLFVDGTHKTNNEKRPLICFAIKDGFGKIKVTLRAFVPNERSWLFNWLFSQVLPLILGREGCKKVRLFISDGDSQECNQLDSAIKTHFPNAVRRRCSWHIIDKGWERHLPALSKKDGTAGQQIEYTVKGWLYSLATDVETEAEYLYSREKLEEFVQSPLVVRAIKKELSVAIIDWLRNYVFPHDKYFVACYFHDSAPFGCHSNTCLEGTNKGVKYAENRVLPNHTTARSAKQINAQDRERIGHMSRSSATDFFNTPLQKTATSGFLNHVADSELMQAIKQSELYVSCRIAPYRWRVFRHQEAPTYVSTKNNDSSSKGLVRPKFRRTREVWIDDDGRWRCTCCSGERDGVHDRHVVHVILHYGGSAEEITYKDCALRHHSSYNRLVGHPRQHHPLAGAEEKLRSLLTSIRNQEYVYKPPLACKHKLKQYSPTEKQVRYGKQAIQPLSSLTADQLFELPAVTCTVDPPAGHLVCMPVGVRAVVSPGTSFKDCSDDAVDVFAMARKEQLTQNLTLYQQSLPLLKELSGVVEGLPPDLRKEHALSIKRMLDEMLSRARKQANKGKKPDGKWVSCMSESTTEPRYHKKQRHF